MKKIIITVAAALTLTACGSQQEPVTVPADTSAPDPSAFLDEFLSEVASPPSTPVRRAPTAGDLILPDTGDGPHA